MNLTVLGAGAWGTALAINVAARHPTQLWARDAGQALLMRSTMRNARYLPEVSLPAELHITSDFESAVAHARDGLVIIATPMAGLGDMLLRLRASHSAALWLCKGLQQGTGWLGHEVARALLGADARVGVLSGPSFAIEVARGQPTALVAASTDADLCDAAVAALHCDSLRVYTSNASPSGPRSRRLA